MPYDPYTKTLLLPNYVLPQLIKAEDDALNAIDLKTRLSWTVSTAVRHDICINGQAIFMKNATVKEEFALSILIEKLATEMVGDERVRNLVREVCRLIDAVNESDGSDEGDINEIYSNRAQLILMLLMNLNSNSFSASNACFIGYMQQIGFIRPVRSGEKEDHLRDVFNIRIKQEDKGCCCELVIKNQYEGWVLSDDLEGEKNNKTSLVTNYQFTKVEEQGLAYDIVHTESQLRIKDLEGGVLYGAFSKEFMGELVREPHHITLDILGKLRLTMEEWIQACSQIDFSFVSQEVQQALFSKLVEGFHHQTEEQTSRSDITLTIKNAHYLTDVLLGGFLDAVDKNRISLIALIQCRQVLPNGGVNLLDDYFMTKEVMLTNFQLAAFIEMSPASESAESAESATNGLNRYGLHSSASTSRSTTPPPGFS